MAFADLAEIVFEIVELTVPLLSFLAVALFFWGLAKFLLSEGDESALTSGKHLMFWGIVGILVIFSVWGILSLLATSIGMSNIGLPQLPTS